MIFLVDNKQKVIFGWSAKCGYSHIKTIYWFLQTGKINNIIHTPNDNNKLPYHIQKYITIIFIRNPYKRLISGFLDKYKKGGEYRHKWKNTSLSFSNFVDTLVKKDWNIIDHHHFIPQTGEYFGKNILESKEIKIFDIANIDYKYIEALYNKKIPADVINKKQGHERQIYTRSINYNISTQNIDSYINYNIDIKYFYTDDIKKKVYKFYIDDFIFFKENGFDYTNTI
jgi:hypothetical protein